MRRKRSTAKPEATIRPTRPPMRGWLGRGRGMSAYVQQADEWRGTTVQVCGLWPGVSCFVWTVGPVERILDMSTPRPRREYSAEFRADAVRMVTELGKPRSQVARELELNVSTLGRWVATEIGTLGTGRGSARRAPDPESTDPHEMQREISRLREENEFLKKAAAFFAKEQL